MVRVQPACCHWGIPVATGGAGRWTCRACRSRRCRKSRWRV